MHFRLVARDRKAVGGGTAYDEVALTVDKTTGPFRVTSQASPASVVGGSAQTVTWTANTAALAANVKISLSIDGGQTFPTVLLASTPNDGVQSVTLPAVATAAARIKVEARRQLLLRRQPRGPDHHRAAGGAHRPGHARLGDHPVLRPARVRLHRRDGERAAGLGARLADRTALRA